MDAGSVDPPVPDQADAPLTLAGMFVMDMLVVMLVQVPAWLLVWLLLAWPMEALGAPLPELPRVALVWLLTAGFACHYRCRPAPGELAAAHAVLGRVSTWGWVALGVLAMGAVDVAVFQVGEWGGAPLVPANQGPIEELLQASPWLAWLAAVLLAPVAEELVFRRVLFGRFLRAGRPWLGLVLTSALFAFMHEVPGLAEGPWWAVGLLWIAYFSSGAVFAGLYWRTGSLWAPILAHMASNALTLW